MEGTVIGPIDEGRDAYEAEESVGDCHSKDSTVRRIIQRRQYIDLLSWNRMISNQSASAIQSILRGKLTRRMYMQQIQRRQSAANNIQRVFRGKLGREEYHRLRQLWLEKLKKPKPVPLHMRRYSTYGNNRSAGGKMNKKFVMTRRRSSVEDMSQSLRMMFGNHHEYNQTIRCKRTI